MPRLLSIARTIAVNLAVLAIGLIVLELAFGGWLFGPSWGMMNIPHDISRVFDVSDLYGGPKQAVYRRDHWGLRGAYPDPGHIDILTLGGSTTDQHFVGEGETWQDALAQQFAAAGHPLSVVNAGIDGQSTVGHLRALDQWLPQIPGLKVRFVLAYIGVNDAHVDAQAQYDDMRSPSLGRRISRMFQNNSAVLRLFNTVAGTLKARQAHIVHGGTGVASGPWVAAAKVPDLNAAVEAERLTAYGQRVTALIERVRAMGAEAIIVSQSRSDYRVREGKPLGRVMGDTSINTGSWAMQTALNHRAMESCRAAAAICIDLGDELTFEDGDFYDWVHTTPTGNRRIAAYLFSRLDPRVR
jgi:hypothetical protein